MRRWSLVTEKRRTQWSLDIGEKRLKLENETVVTSHRKVKNKPKNTEDSHRG
uniref:Uncharacterized protein n=1 Tax=Nelumbo nucifera TaxID=4432 RepID=A0A822YJV1_NELNU|nr:TPA_asm: hypothetical protein HUJ06_011244 [Nelumbo nucifera]